MRLPRDVGIPEIERPKIHRLERTIIYPMKRKTYKAALQNVLPLCIEIDRPCRERLILDPGDPIPVPLIHMDNPRHRILLEGPVHYGISRRLRLAGAPRQ